MKEYTQYVPSSDTDTGLSEALWADAPLLEAQAGVGKYHLHVEDWRLGSTFADGTDQVGYDPALATDGTLAVNSAQDLAITTGGADNDDGSVQFGEGVAVPFVISDSDPRPLWFECRIRLKTSAVEAGFFAGLAEAGFSKADVLTDNTAAIVGTGGVVGFNAQAGAGTARSIDFVHADATGGGGLQVEAAGIGSATADTWVKLGFHYNADSKKIHVYVNGELAHTVLTSVIGEADFPDGDGLNALFAIKAGEASAKVLEVDWWAILQPAA